MPVPSSVKVMQSAHLNRVGDYNDLGRSFVVEFVNGSKYVVKAPRQVWDGLRAAGSPGTFYHQQIRNRYQVERISE